MTEFKLSESFKEGLMNLIDIGGKEYIDASAKEIHDLFNIKVKEFIKLLKEKLEFLRKNSYNYLECMRIIGNLTGDLQ